jgi:hypothetical protein
MLSRRSPVFAPTVVSTASDQPSNIPVIFPLFARNSAMTWR